MTSYAISQWASALTDRQISVDSGPVDVLYLDVSARLATKPRFLARRHRHVRLRYQYLKLRVDVFV